MKFFHSPFLFSTFGLWTVFLGVFDDCYKNGDQLVRLILDGLAKSRHARQSGHPVFGQVIEVPGFPPARE
jgi:hypothetical protein